MAGLAITATLVACGGGGDSGGGSSTQITAVPLQIAIKNIYDNSWQRSGVITAQRYTFISDNCGGKLGGCFLPISNGNFTTTVSQQGTQTIGNIQVKTTLVSRAEVFDGLSIPISFTASFKTDFSAYVESQNCILPIPATVSIGYTAILTCTTGTPVSPVSIKITTGSTADTATLTIINSFGTENYTVGANGTVGPINVQRSGTIAPGNNITSYITTLIY